MDLFEIVKKIFSKNDWGKVSNSDKGKNFFMINRIMSIQFPVQANQFNKNKINPVPVIDWWHGAMSSNYKSTPPWIYTKTKKNEKKTKEYDFSEEEKFVCERLMVSIRDLEDLKEFFPDRYTEWMKSIKKQIKGESNAK